MGTHETKWTAGPWRINKYGSIGAGPLGHAPIVGYVEPFYGEDKRDGDSSANAQLIASAPELYEELMKSAIDMENMAKLLGERGLVDFADDLRLSAKSSRAILSKAHGEE